MQLTFSIPLPEPFDLRTQFLEEAQLIYEEVMGNKIAGELLVDLKTAVDRQGSKLSTPREVKLALNGIRFVFPQIKDDVYFPDFCRLHLIKTTHYKLYQWLESYLSVRSVLVTGDATVASDERAEMGKVLKKLLPSEGVGSAQSIWSLQRFVPGVSNQKKPEESVFNRAGTMSVSKTISLKRLGSPLHYRFYFALTGPKTVMSDNDFNSLLELARSDVEKLVSRLSEEVEKRRGSGKTWFEHVLDRLDDGCISNLDEKQLEGFLLAFADMMDTAISVGNNQDFFFVTVDQAADSAAQCCLSRLQVLNPDKQAETVRKIASDGKAINWLVGYFFRNQLFRHGKVGDKAEHPDQWEISEKVLDQAIEILRERVRQPDIKEIIPSLPDVSAYLYGWINISENDDAVAWVQKYCESDEGFLKILDHLRGWAMSDRVYYPLSAESVSRFLDWNETTMRLKQLKDGEFSEKVAELEMAIKQSRH